LRTDQETDYLFASCGTLETATVYRKPKAVHAENQACARRGPRRTVKITLWAATVLVAAAVALPYYAPLLLDA
jgi:mercuric ion transport protein